MAENIKPLIGELLPCKWCGTEPYFERISPQIWAVRTCCKHMVTGPIMPTRKEAADAWDEMMAPQVQATLEATGTSHRDRIDRMAAAIVAYKGTDRLDEISIARAAISQIRAIDAEIEKREREKQQEVKQ
jgi:ribosomal protein L37AE/L43A